MPKIVDDKLFAETVQYLASRPYSEVATGIDGLSRSTDTSKLFGELAACIRTGQVPQEAVPAMVAADPAFAGFYHALSEKLSPQA